MNSEIKDSLINKKIELMKKLTNENVIKAQAITTKTKTFLFITTSFNW